MKKCINKCCRVVSKQRDQYSIKLESEVKQATIKGSVLHKIVSNSELPVVGDWVNVAIYNDSIIIEEVVERKTQISRKVAGATTEEQIIATNVDFVIIVLGLDGGRNYSDRLLERYMAMAWESGATPLVVLNKADLNDQSELVKAQAEIIAPCVDIIICSAKDGTGLEEIASILSDEKTAAFVGPSGVGKSALTNALLHKELAKTGVLRSQDKRGRHTTSCSTLFELPGGGYIVDSPGLREIQLWACEDDIDMVFDEISSISEECRFNNCKHQSEPGCAVQIALENGDITPERYDSYLNLKRELDFLERRKGEKGRYNEHIHNKNLGKMYKAIKKKKDIY